MCLQSGQLVAEKIFTYLRNLSPFDVSVAFTLLLEADPGSMDTPELSSATKMSVDALAPVTSAKDRLKPPLHVFFDMAM